MTASYGFNSPIWMARAVIQYAPERMLRKSVDDLVLFLADGLDETVTADILIDRLVQGAVVGQYMAPKSVLDSIREAIAMADELIRKNTQKASEGFTEEEISKFSERLAQMPEFDPEGGDEPGEKTGSPEQPN